MPSQNIGKTDKIIRIVIAIIIIAAGVYYKSWWGALALIPIVTVISGRCTLYYLFKISTIKKGEKTGEQKNDTNQDSDSPSDEEGTIYNP